MRLTTKSSFLDVLNSNLAETPFYRNMFSVVGNVLDDYVDEPIEQLKRLRSPTHIKRGDTIKTDRGYGKVAHLRRVTAPNGTPLDEITVQLRGDEHTMVVRRALQDRGVLIEGSRYAGFDYYSDLLSDEDYARIYQYANTFWPYTGREDFIHFIGYVKQVRFQIEQLWTRDKGDNATSDDPEISKHSTLEPFDAFRMAPVFKGGQDYPTSHVQIIYNALDAPQLNKYDTVSLFYYLAPVHLVLHRIVAQVEALTRYTIVAKGNLMMVNSAYLEID